MNDLSIALAQLNCLVGDIDGNADKIIAAALEARDLQHADVVVFSELTLSGYPPEDLLLRASLDIRIEQALEKIKNQVSGIHVILGYPARRNGSLLNIAGHIHNGEILLEYAKQSLPNYEVFDEKRYFSEGTQAGITDINGVKIALTVCEDIWQETPMDQAKAANADIMFNLNASPYHIDKPAQREALLALRAKQGGMPIIYVNQVGGQDELVFDGSSMAVDAQGELKLRLTSHESDLQSIQYSNGKLSQGVIVAEKSSIESIYHTLVLGVRDYVNKNGFKGVVLGLSGGIDSALTLAIAVDAIGADRVEAIMMPFKYTSNMSQEDAEAQANAQGVKYRVMSIEPLYDAFLNTLAPAFEGTTPDTTEENLQARCRGVLLMAMSNKHGHMVITTGNKSEMAVGYATLYGDMVGGYSALKDVFKMTVFDLSRYRNTISQVIPQRVIDRPPSAELAPDQKDEDSLPPYEALDVILAAYIEQDLSAHDIIDMGFDESVVRRIIRLVDINEYKRRQAPVGVRITQKGFGRDRRYPMTSGWKAGI
jgi:NAD+ synthase (glutamine-hydrolysing)